MGRLPWRQSSGAGGGGKQAQLASDLVGTGALSARSSLHQRWAAAAGGGGFAGQT